MPDYRWKWSSYGGTAGLAKPHGALTTDWVLAQFGEKKATAEKKYREFVKGGIGGATIHDTVKAQSILGREEFVEKLIGHVRGYEKVKEIPRSQRYLGRPTCRSILRALKKRRRGIEKLEKR